MSYAELAVTTNYSFLRGASHPGEFVTQAHALGYAAIGIAYPGDRPAYGRLCRLLSLGKSRAPKGECFLSLSDLVEPQYREGLLLIVMPAGLENITPILTRLGPDTWLAASMLYTGEDRRRLRDLASVARAARVPLIAVNDALYHDADRRELQDIVTCIREHLSLPQAGKRLQANAERHLKHPGEMIRLFSAAPAAIAETRHFAGRINFTLDMLKQNYPHEPVPPGKTADGHLRDLTKAGEQQIAHYFLTVHDIVKYAEGRDILCQGRGSAANSAVCYALGVTAVDPNAFDVLFERFLSAERREPPDIDVDFEHERREEVIQYIYRRYGRRRAALTATVICYRARSAIREVGKVFGLTEDVTGRLADTVWGHHGGGLEEHQIRQGDCDPANLAVALY